MIKIIQTLVLAYVGLIIFLYFFQRGVIYYPARSLTPPAAVGLAEIEVVKLNTEDGLDLVAWYEPAKNGKPTFVYFHGNAGSIANRADIIKPYIAAEYGVLLVEYRGYGGNPGRPSEQGLYKDGRAALDFLKERSVSNKSIIVYGESIGTGVAVQMAAEREIAGLILRTPMTTLADVGSYHYPFLPVRIMLKDRYNSLDKIKDIHVPVLMFHGSLDKIIPIQFGHQLYMQANEPKEIWVYEDKGHNDYFHNASKVIDYVEKTYEF